MSIGRNVTYYDENFGHYDIESEEDIEFYNQVQRNSVEKTCRGCDRKVRIMPQYAYCDSCATKREQGWDI